jgi:hypothetical protein
MTAFKWLPSTGMDSFWIGGPLKDKSADDNLGITKSSPDCIMKIIIVRII